MLIRLNPNEYPRKSSLCARSAYFCAGQFFVLMVLVSCQAAAAQDHPSIQFKPRTSLLMPAANPMPDANDRMLMHERQMKKQDFEAVNALRKKSIADDSLKLILLTRDLQAKIAKSGDGPVSADLTQEARVIEQLARDVQKKMKMTMGPD